MEIAHIMEERKPPVFLVYTPDVKVDAARIAVSLRRSVPTVLDVMGRSMGAQLKAASGAGARHAVMGREELDSGRPDPERRCQGEQEGDLRGDSRTALFICLNLVSGEEPTSISDECFHQNFM